MTDFEQYLRDNPMPTKSVDNENYYVVECNFERGDYDD